jgi:hypothetical protein
MAFFFTVSTSRRKIYHDCQAAIKKRTDLQSVRFSVSFPEDAFGAAAKRELAVDYG